MPSLVSEDKYIILLKKNLKYFCDTNIIHISWNKFVNSFQVARDFQSLKSCILVLCGSLFYSGISNINFSEALPQTPPSSWSIVNNPPRDSGSTHLIKHVCTSHNFSGSKPSLKNCMDNENPVLLATNKTKITAMFVLDYSIKHNGKCYNI